MIADVSVSTIMVISAMAIVTVFVRWAGFYLIGFVSVGPRVEAAFRTLPGAVAAATILPIVANDGASALAAVLVSGFAAYRGASDFVAVLCGLGVAILLRLFHV